MVRRKTPRPPACAAPPRLCARDSCSLNPPPGVALRLNLTRNPARQESKVLVEGPHAGNAGSCLQFAFSMGGDPVAGASGSILVSKPCPATENSMPTFAMCPNTDDCSACVEADQSDAWAKTTEIVNIVGPGPAKCVDFQDS